MEALKEKSGFRFWRCRKGGKFSREKIVRSDMRVDNDVFAVVLDGREVVSCQKNGEGEVVRMKILVKKENLEKVLEAMRTNAGKSSDIASIPSSSSVYLEEFMNAMKRRRISRDTPVRLRCHDHSSSWRPSLFSIPE